MGKDRRNPGAAFRWWRGAFGVVVCAALAASPVLAQDLLRPETCLATPDAVAATAAQTRLRGLLDSLAPHLAAFPSLAEALERSQPKLCLDTGASLTRGYFEVEANAIVLHRNLSDGEMMAILIHELRHLEQLDRGYCPSTAFAMQENARAVMAIEADAMAITALVTWSMREAGAPEAWEALLGFPRYGDIAGAFGTEMTQTGVISAAVSAAFTQWYASDWRRTSYEMASCSDYLDQMDETHVLPRYDLLPSDFLEQLCRLPDGSRYPCEALSGPQ